MKFYENIKIIIFCNEISIFLKYLNSKMSSFIDAISTTYQQILKSCLQDQALETLKSLESHECISQRVSQIFSQIFNQQRQKLIQKLNNKNIQLIQQCEELKKNTISNQKVSNFTVNDTSNNLNIAIMAENEQLKIQLTKLRQKHMNHTQQLQYKIQKLTTQLESGRNFYEKQINRISKLVQQKTNSIKTYIEERHKFTEENQKLKDSISALIHKQSSTQIAIRDNNHKLQTEINTNRHLKQSKQILQEKVIRMQEQNTHLQELLVKYQQQSKILKQRTQKKQNIYIPQQEISTARQTNTQLIAKLTSKEKLLAQMKKQKESYKENSQKIEREFNEYQYNTQIKIKQLQEQLQDNRNKFDRQIKVIRQQSNKQQQKRRQHFQIELQQKTSTIISQYQQKLLKNKEQITSLTRKFNEINLQYLKNSQTNVQSQQRYKTQLQTLKILYQQQQDKNKQLNNLNNIQKSHYESTIQQLKNKVKTGELQYDQLMKINAQIQARSTKNQIQLQRLQKIQKYKNAENDQNRQQLSYIEKQLKQQLQQKSQIIQQHRHQTTQLKNLKNTLQVITENLQNEKTKNQKLQLKIVHFNESIQNAELQLKKQKENKIQMQINNQRQISKLKNQHLEEIDTVRKQIQKHYESLLRNREGKGLRISEEISEYKNTIIQLQKSIGQLKKLNEIQKRQITESNQYLQTQQTNNQKNMLKIKQLQEKIKINTQNQFKEKQKMAMMNHLYDQQIQNYKNKFRSFKLELFNCLKDIFDSLRTDCQQINQQINQIKNLIASETTQIYTQLQQKCASINQIIQKKINFFKDTYGSEKIQAAINLTKQSQQKHKKMLKEKTLEMMTVLAEKQFQLKSLAERETNIKKKYQEYSERILQLQKKQRQMKLQYEQLKLSKQNLQIKLRQSEREASNLKHCYQEKISENQYLQQTIARSQKAFKQKLQECKQKYLHENEKIFDRYEKQFAKLINFNNRGKQSQCYGLSTSSSFTNLNDNYMRPTSNKNLSKMAKIKQEIDEQKKKIKILNKQ